MLWARARLGNQKQISTAAWRNRAWCLMGNKTRNFNPGNLEATLEEHRLVYHEAAIRGLLERAKSRRLQRRACGRLESGLIYGPWPWELLSDGPQLLPSRLGLARNGQT